MHEQSRQHYLNFDFSIIPRMTRDFEIKIKDEKNTIDVLDFLNKAKIISGEKTVKAFGFVDKQSSNTLFASFMYQGEEKDVDLTYNGKRISIKNEINFVAIKNGGHDNRGWVYGNIKKENIVTNTEIWNLSNIIFKDSNLDII